MNDTTEVKLHFLDYWRVVRARWVLIFLTFLLVVTTAGVTCFFLPREYFSVVKLQVQDDSKIISIGGGPGFGGIKDPKFVTTQFEIIQTKEILYPVIESLGLKKKWKVGGSEMPDEFNYFKLKRMMNMQEVRGTDLIQMGVWSRDPEEAAAIANTIAVEYQKKRRADQDSLLNRGFRELEEEVKNQRLAVKQKADAAAEIRAKNRIVDLNPDTLETPETMDKSVVMGLQARSEEQKLTVLRLKGQMEQVDKLKPEELMVALRLLELDDPTIAKNLPLFQESVAEIARLTSSGIGKKHPRIQALEALKVVYTQQLIDATTALRASLVTKLSIADAQLSSIDEQLKRAQDIFRDGGTQDADYIQAKTDYIMTKRLLDNTEQRLNTEKIDRKVTSDPAKIWERAEAASGPGKPNVLLYMAIATALGMMLGVALAFFIEYLDTSVKSLEDVERSLGVPVLAVIPSNIHLLHTLQGDTPDAEAYRILRTNLELHRKDPRQNSVTLISGGPGEGKSTTLCNLAYTCAKGGYNVLVVDADLRRPSQHRIWGVENKRGLTDYLTGKADWEECVMRIEDASVSFMPAGLLAQEAIGILNSQRMVELIQQAKRRYDLVFFDSPPILGVSDGSVLASEVDITLMVIQHRRFPRNMLVRVKQAVLNVGGNLLGAVLNNVDSRQDQGYQYYTGYKDYYTTQGKNEEAAPKTNGTQRPRTASVASEDEDQY